MSRLMVLPPDYLANKVCSPADKGPAVSLIDGKWCGHGESKFAVFDICFANESTFAIRLPATSFDIKLRPPVVMIVANNLETFAAYDPRQHPASIFHASNTAHTNEPRYGRFLCCANCGLDKFELAVGFAIPRDSQTTNDTSWFALAAKCMECGWSRIVYEDETA